MVLGTIHPARIKERKQSITAPVYAINIFVGMKEIWTHISQSDLESSVRMYWELYILQRMQYRWFPTKLIYDISCIISSKCSLIYRNKAYTKFNIKCNIFIASIK